MWRREKETGESREYWREKVTWGKNNESTIVCYHNNKTLWEVAKGVWWWQPMLGAGPFSEHRTEHGNHTQNEVPDSAAVLCFLPAPSFLLLCPYWTPLTELRLKRGVCVCVCKTVQYAFATHSFQNSLTFSGWRLWKSHPWSLSLTIGWK